MQKNTEPTIDIVDIPEEEDVSSLPSDITLEQYWEANNSFLNAWDDGIEVCLAYRSTFSGLKLVKRIPDFRWYFHVFKRDWGSLPFPVRNEVKKHANAIESSGRYVKIYCDNQSISEMYSDEQDARLRIKTILDRHGILQLEGDLKNYKRYCIDNQIKISNDFKIAFFDIETDDRQDGIVIGRDRIISFAFVDQEGKERFYKIKEFSDRGEKELLSRMKEVFEFYDIIITWNGNNFDMPYVRDRFEKIMGYRMSMKYIAHIDFMKRFQKLFQSDVNIRSWGLDFISKYFVGEGKVELTQGTYEMWEKNPVMLKKYNLHDARLMYLLEQKLKVLSLIILECQWTGTFPSKFYVSELLDNYILRWSNPKGVHFRSTSFNHSISKEDKKKAKEGEENHVTGGFVREPIRGVHEWMHIFDFKSLYPTIVMTWNISQDVFHTEEPEDASKFMKTVNGYWTEKDKQGMLPNVINMLLEARKEFKKKQLSSKFGTQEYEVAQGTQQVVKELANSAYGIMAQMGNRYYSKETAEAITLAGQHMAKYSAEVFMKEFGFVTAYQDSVAPVTCIAVKIDENISILTIKEFFEAHKYEVKLERGKEVIYPSNNVSTLSGQGRWKKIKRIIRHSTNKEVYDVTCPDGTISVTTDHSFYSGGKTKSPLEYEEQSIYDESKKIDRVPKLKLEFTNKIKELDLYSRFLEYSKILTNKQFNHICIEKSSTKMKIGIKAKDTKRTSKLFNVNSKLKINYDFGFCIGGYIAEGSISKKDLNYSNPILYCNTNRKEAIEFFKSAKKVFGRSAVSFHEWNNNCYRVKLNCREYALFLHELCGYSSQYKQMPDFILDTNEEFVRGLIYGYILGDGQKEYRDKNLRTGNVGGKSRKFISQCYFILANYFKNDYHFHFKQFYRQNCEGFVFVDKGSASKESIRSINRWLNRKQIYRRPHKSSYDGYVYDIEVEDDHTFVDQCGGLILHNTDSCFVAMKRSHSKEEVSEMLKIIHARYSDHLKKEFDIDKSHIVLEYEKKYRRIILLHKKQYVGRLVEVDGKEVDEIYGRGIEYVKKDTIAYAARLQKQMLRHMLYEDHDVGFYHNFVKREKKKFQEGSILVDDLVISQKLSKHPSKYKKGKQVHVRIAEQRIKDGKEFYVGIMIPYIVTGTKPKLQGVHLEDYDNNFDRSYYWDTRTYHPLKRFLECVYPDEDWSQYEFETLEKRAKKFNQYSRWLREKSKAKRRDEYIAKMQADKVLSSEQKEKLLLIAQGKSPFKVSSRGISSTNGDSECLKKNQKSLNSRLREKPTSLSQQQDTAPREK